MSTRASGSPHVLAQPPSSPNHPLGLAGPAPEGKGEGKGEGRHICSEAAALQAGGGWSPAALLSTRKRALDSALALHAHRGLTAVSGGLASPSLYSWSADIIQCLTRSPRSFFQVKYGINVNPHPTSDRLPVTPSQ